MTLHSYLMFVVASVALVLVPGPDMLYILGRCIAQGKRAGVMAAVGVNLGSYVHLAAALLGLSAILAASSRAFTAVRWVGAAYLVYLGVMALRNARRPLSIDASGAAQRAHRTILWQAFLSDVLNPKVAMFYLALLPQFVNPGGWHPSLQILILGLTVNVIALPMNLLLVHGSALISAGLRRRSEVAVWLNRALGVLFVGIGLRLATEKG